jgi:hypothetical protein
LVDLLVDNLVDTRCCAADFLSAIIILLFLAALAVQFVLIGFALPGALAVIFPSPRVSALP